MTTLTYRGIQFESNNASVETADLGISGTYRGSKTSFSRSAVRSSTGADLQFLGKKYAA